MTSNGAGQSFSNPTSITIPAFGEGPGPAAPYPSTIIVPELGAPVNAVTVTLMGLTHSFPADIDVLLVGPQGQTVLLMSDCGGSTSISGVKITFSHGAPPLPNSGGIPSGTYSPTNYAGAPDTFSAPAPPPPYGNQLSVFQGTDAAGVWRLFIMDNAGLTPAPERAGGVSRFPCNFRSPIRGY